MKKLFDGLMEVRSQYSSMMQAHGLDKWQTRETMIYRWGHCARWVPRPDNTLSF